MVCKLPEARVEDWHRFFPIASRRNQPCWLLRSLYGQGTQDSCSLTLCQPPCLTSACFNCILSTSLTFLHTCLRPQLVIVLTKGAVRGQAPSWDSLVTNEPTWGQLLCDWQSPPTPSRQLPCPACPWWPSADVAPRPCFRHVRSAHPLNFCYWLWVLSSVLKLGRHRPCRDAAQQSAGQLRWRKPPWTLRCREGQGRQWKLWELATSMGARKLWV